MLKLCFPVKNKHCLHHLIPDKKNYEHGNNIKVIKRATIRNQYNQVSHLTQNTNRTVTISQVDITNESQKVSPFPAGDHKATIKNANE